MSDPHKHHYVPEFYQRGFIADGTNRIWVYHKDRAPRRYYTRKTGMRLDLYAFRDIRGVSDSTTVERQLADLDVMPQGSFKSVTKG